MRRCVQAITAAVLLAACTATATTTGSASTSVSGTAEVSGSPGAGGAPIGPGSPIPQPVVPGNLRVAPDDQRVDMTVPTFSHPTDVSNPLFPVSQQASVLFVGHVDGKPFRTEVTLLPFTRVIQWGGQSIETLVSQYVAYLDGRLQEVAYDLYAQADDGSVWYFGEDVADLAHGDIVTKEGTWTAGKDGPAQMIMPGDPQVGDVYRTENIPGIAFEQVTVQETDRTLRGPVAPIPGGMVGEELHLGGGIEDKLFAPGYGEFFTRDGRDVEALATAVPTDAVSGPMPSGTVRLRAGMDRVARQIASGDWRGAKATVASMEAAWRALRAGDVPHLEVPWVSRTLSELSRAVRAKDAPRARQAVIDATLRILDLEIRYLPTTQIDLARIELWTEQLAADAAVKDASAVNGDVFTLFYLRDRILQVLTPDERTSVDTLIDRLQVSGADHDVARAVTAASSLRRVVADVQARVGAA